MKDFKGIYTEEERNKLIKEEYERLIESSRDLDERKIITLDRLFNSAAFMAVTIEEAEKIIIRDGIIETYQNGANQKGLKKSSAVEVHDKMMNTYSKVMDLINKCLPEGTGKTKQDILNEIDGL